MFSIDLQSRVPIYEQLYKKTVELIIKGILKEDSQMPSVRNLAKQLGVNPNTVAKAYQELERNGVTYSLTGRGSFVAKINQKELKNFALIDFDNAVDEALKAGLSCDDLVHRIGEKQK
ncbi:MAG: GntR family transcriptional regulator [Clostridiales bacterium]|nr:GntR family transcriptional regulator [Clostridiales bacterium]